MLEFARAVPLYDVQITVLTAFPGTPLYDRLLREGRILEPRPLGPVHAVRRELRAARACRRAQLREGMYWLTERLYSDECTEFRRRGFFTHMRRARRQAVVTA